MPVWIADNAAFAGFCREASAVGAVAVDTEFDWTSTFYPRLALLQMATSPEHCALVDVFCITDTQEFRGVLENPQVVKYFHEAASDLPLLRRWTDGALPANIFDTRIAGGFCGLGQTCSLKSLFAQLLNLNIAKTETRSNWLQRPLTEQQKQYAVEDVARMPELAARLRERVEACGNLPRFEEEMLHFSCPETYREELPENYWHRIGGRGNIKPADLAVLKELARWRELTARELNLTRNRVLADKQMLDILNLRLATLNDLYRIPNYYPKQVKRFGEGIVAAINQGRKYTPAQLEEFRQLPLPQDFTASVNRVLGLARKRCASQQIDPLLVCPRRRAEHLVMAVSQGKLKPDDAFFQTWRGTLLGPALKSILFDNKATHR